MELRMYKYRLYPSRKQKFKLLENFKLCKEVYNELLALNQKIWTTNKYDFINLGVDMKRCNPEIGKKVHSQVLQDVSDRLSKAFQNFFNRNKLIKQGVKIKVGFPRFKSKISSITYPQSGFKFINNKKLQVSKIGKIPIILHRVPKGIIKTLTIKQNSAGQWFAVFSCEIDFPVVKHANNKRIGIDVGLENFLTKNTGKVVTNERFYVKAEKKLARLNRSLSRKVKGSKNRNKARIRVARQHLKVFNQRTDFLHKISRRLTKDYKIICGEDLNIKGMSMNHHLAKHILDASWGRFYQMLSYKAITSGGELRINPKTRGSSKRCSKCGAVNDMPLSKRTFVCCSCGFSCHRDVNASNNHIIDTDGLSGISTPVETSPLPSLLVLASEVNEAGTINGK